MWMKLEIWIGLVADVDRSASTEASDDSGMSRWSSKVVSVFL